MAGGKECAAEKSDARVTISRSQARIAPRKAERRSAMQVSEMMTRDAECTRPDATLKEVAERMKALDVGSLPVCEGDRLVGMITDRDITIRSVSGGHDPNTHRVRDIMTAEVFFCFED